MTYWLSVASPNFDIDPRTGQIMVGNVMLDSDGENPTTSYSVTVAASDSSSDGADGTPAGTATIVVTITVVPVDEKPTFPSTGVVTTIEHAEDGDATQPGGSPVTYTATDPEGGSLP